MNHPLLLLVLTAAGLQLLRLWYSDLRSARSGLPHPRALPGATSAPLRAVFIGVTGAVVILVAETVAEIGFGWAGEQSRMTWLFATYSIAAAPVIEEVFFRGWIVIENRGRVALWLGAIAASAVFALLHPHLWQWDELGPRLTLTPKAVFSTVIAFLTSLWFYGARFASWNPHRSLLPCFVAHAAKNAGVVAIKAASGFMGELW